MLSSLPGSLSVSLTQESSCNLPSKDNFYYYLHNTTGTLHFYALQINLLKWPHHAQPRSLHLGRGPQMSPGQIALLKMTFGVLTLLIVFLLISATFVALGLISNQWNTISHPLSNRNTVVCVWCREPVWLVSHVSTFGCAPWCGRRRPSTTAYDHVPYLQFPQVPVIDY